MSKTPEHIRRLQSTDENSRAQMSKTPKDEHTRNNRNALSSTLKDDEDSRAHMSKTPKEDDDKKEIDTNRLQQLSRKESNHNFERKSNPKD